MVMSSRDGTLPPGFWVRATKTDPVGGYPEMTMYVASTSDPGEAKKIVQVIVGGGSDVAVVGAAALTTIERLGIKPGEAEFAG